MGYKEHYIQRSPELAAAFRSCMGENEVTGAQIMKRAGVSYETVRLVLDPAYHNMRGLRSRVRYRVSKELFLQMVISVTGDYDKVSELCKCAAVSLLPARKGKIVALL